MKLVMLIAYKIGLAQAPGVSVEGTVDGQTWSGMQSTSIFQEDEIPTKYSFKVPLDLVDVTLLATPDPYVQHLQLDSGPKLFGESIRVPGLEGDQPELKIYRYQPTTLRIVVADADGQPIELTGGQTSRRSFGSNEIRS